jgi:hypothetical protein
MIIFNKEYIFSRGNGKITFTEGKNEIVNANYKVFNDIGTITGKLIGHKLEATFHSSSMNRVGLIHFEFFDDGFDAKWKNGLEPGVMRGKWFTSNKSNNEGDFTFNINDITNWDFEDKIEDEIERIFQISDTNARDTFVKKATDFINQHNYFYWLSLLIYYKAQDCYYTSGDDDLESFFIGFEIKKNNLNFDPSQKFSLDYDGNSEDDNHWLSPKDFKWSSSSLRRSSFVEVILKEMEIDLSNYEDTQSNFALIRNAATSYLWVSLQDYSSEFPEAEDFANCLWSVFSEEANDIEIFKADGNFAQEALDNILKYILRLDKEAFNADENPEDRDDLNSFNDYVHDYIKISEEILEKDIFDM